MSAFAAQVLTLVTHLVAFLQTFGDRAVPVAKATLKFLDIAEPYAVRLVPAAAPYSDAIQLALNLIVEHGAEIVADIGDVMKLLDSVGTVTPKLAAIAAAATPEDVATAMAATA